MTSSRSLGKIAFGVVIAVIGIGFLTAIAWIWFTAHEHGKSNPPRELVREQSDIDACYPVVIRRPDGQMLVDSGKQDERGQPILVSCATCHDTREPNAAIHQASQFDEFHQGLKYAHGELTCISCHSPKDYNTLHKSDGTPVSASDSMNLCAQCHGPQYRDYRNGSHGGMTGYWDLTRGGRTRNTCVNCHDPHHPAFPEVMPVFPPKPAKGETIRRHE